MSSAQDDFGEESDATIARRKQIQAIMRDTSISAREKQTQIQKLMASGTPAVTPSSAPAPAPAPPASVEPPMAAANPPPPSTNVAPAGVPQGRGLKGRGLKGRGLRSGAAAATTTATAMETATTPVAAVGTEPPQTTRGTEPPSSVPISSPPPPKPAEPAADTTAPAVPGDVASSSVPASRGLRGKGAVGGAPQGKMRGRRAAAPGVVSVAGANPPAGDDDDVSTPVSPRREAAVDDDAAASPPKPVKPVDSTTGGTAVRAGAGVGGAPQGKMRGRRAAAPGVVSVAADRPSAAAAGDASAQAPDAPPKTAETSPTGGTAVRTGTGVGGAPQGKMRGRRAAAPGVVSVAAEPSPATPPAAPAPAPAAAPAAVFPPPTTTEPAGSGVRTGTGFGGAPQGKMRGRRAAAPGVVSVAAAEPSPASAPAPAAAAAAAAAPAGDPSGTRTGTGFGGAPQGKMRGRRAAAPGVVSVAAEPSPPVPDEAAAPAATEPGATGAVRPAMGFGGAPQGKMRGRRAAAPGVVSVAAEPPTSDTAAPDPAPAPVPAPAPAPMSVEERDAQVKRGMRRTTAASRPGVESVAPTQEPASTGDNDDLHAAVSVVEQDMQAKRGLRRTAMASTPGVETVVSLPVAPSDRSLNAAVSVVEQDMQAKRGLRRTAAASTPGVEAVAPIAGSEPSSRTLDVAVQSVEQDAQTKRGLRRGPAATTPGVSNVSARTMNVAMQSVELDAQAKRGLRRTTAATVPGVEAESLDASVSIIEQDAQTKRGLRRGPSKKPATPGVESVSGESTEKKTDTKSGKDDETRVGVQSASSGADLYTKRMEDKIKEMETKDEMDMHREREIQRKKNDPTRLNIVGVNDDPKDDFKDEIKDSTTPKATGPSSGEDEAAAADQPQQQQIAIDPNFKELDHSEAIAKAKDEGLAIATAVEEDDEEENLILAADAKEYDPDAKPPIWKNRRFRCYAFLCIVLTIGVVVGAVIPTVTTSPEDIIITQEPSAAPSEAPTTSRESDFRREFVEAVQKNFEFNSSYDRAARWIMFDDPMQLEVDDDNLIQRFILTLFWFQTTDNGNSPWITCNPPTKDETDNCTFGYLQRNQNDGSLEYDMQENQTRWLTGASECQWVGVWCEQDYVIGLEMQGQNMTGTLPAELAVVEYFSFFIFSFNLFTGNIPSEWSDLRYLFMVEVMGNLLTGQIPGGFFRRGGNLWELNSAMNAVDGTIPTEIGYLSELQNLYFFETNMEGTIPTEIGEVRHFTNAQLYGNNFTGSIPSELGRCIRLKNIFLFQNRFTGTIPSEVGNLINAQFIKWDTNQIEGQIPEEFYNMGQLTRLELFDLQLSGTISTRIGQLSNLQTLLLRGNQLTGPIPTELGGIPNLMHIWIHYNSFTGPVPNQMCDLSYLRFGFLNADCGPDYDPANPCDCCSGCCDRETQTCLRTGI